MVGLLSVSEGQSVIMAGSMMAGGHSTGAVPESSHLTHTQQVGRAHSFPGTHFLILPKQFYLLGNMPSNMCACGGIHTECIKEKSPRPNPEALQDSGQQEEDAESETCGEEPNLDSTSKGNKIVLEEADQR